MGLAASQARYLSLTARKTNVEYMGQQVNQQRTLLANESANMYNELMSLDVPTAPSEEDYTTTDYEFSQKAGGDYEYEFDIDRVSANSDGTYNIPLTRYVEGNIANLSVSYASKIDEPSGMIIIDGVAYEIKAEDIPNETTDVKQANSIEMLAKSNANFQKDETRTDNMTTVYTFRKNDQDYYVSQIDYNKLKILEQAESFRPSYISMGTVEESGEIKGYLTKEDNGRYSAITIAGDYNDLGLVNGERFDMNPKTVVDEEAYNQAMKDFEYQKALYDKKIEEINAKTRNIQIQDRTLELKLRQLDTEQEALKTELDSVKQVIKDSCERIFKTFQSS